MATAAEKAAAKRRMAAQKKTRKAAATKKAAKAKRAKGKASIKRKGEERAAGVRPRAVESLFDGGIGGKPREHMKRTKRITGY